jgi:hypothetical protein
MTPDAKRKAARRGYHHDAQVAAELGIRHVPLVTTEYTRIAAILGVGPAALFRWQATGIPEHHQSRAVLVDGRVKLRSDQ